MPQQRLVDKKENTEMTEMEKMLLSTLMMEKDLRHKLYSIEPDTLESDEGRMVFDILREDVNADPLEIHLKLMNKMGIQPDFMDNVVYTWQFDTVLNNLQIHYQQRVLQKRLKALLKDVEDNYDPTTVTGELTALQNIVEQGYEGHYVSSLDACDQTIESLESIWEKDEDEFKLPYVGGLTAELFCEELVAIAGRPGMGKTTVMLNMAREYAQKKIPVAFISLEMGQNALMLRLAQKNWSKSLKYHIKKLTELEKDQLRNDIADLSNLTIFFNDDKKVNPSINSLIASITMLAKKEHCKVIFLDYLQLIPTKDKGSRNEEVAEISRTLKILAKHLGIVIVVGSQLSRKCEMREDKRPKQSDLRDSGAIEQDCDVIIFCYRDGYYYPKSDQNKLELIVDKQRDGITGTVVVHCDLGRMLITDGR